MAEVTPNVNNKFINKNKFDLNLIRKEFPALNQKVNGNPLVYFDNSATTHKPLKVIDSIHKFYSSQNSNVHRGVHFLSQTATDAYEASRVSIKNYINALHQHEIIFTHGTTEAINIIAATFSEKYFKPGKEVIISTMEHHSNIVPWQMACEKHGAKLKIIPISPEGELDMISFKAMINKNTSIISVAHVSNTLGTINPVKEIISEAHKYDIPVLVDGAQAMPHFKVDVLELDCDFYCFSGHKMFGPTGTGVLYGKEKYLDDLPPFMGGGDMIKTVSFENTVYNKLPHKFEPGTPHIAGIIALNESVKFLSDIDMDLVVAYEKDLFDYTNQALKSIKELKIIGTAKNKVPVFSFLLDNIHPYDAGTILDKLGIAIRTGHHCTQPLMDFLKIPGTARASLAFYNTKEEVDTLVNGIYKLIKMFK